jgi:acyl carrier protein
MEQSNKKVMQANYFVNGQNVLSKQVNNVDEIHTDAKLLLDEFGIDSIDCTTENYNYIINRPKNG